MLRGIDPCRGKVDVENAPLNIVERPRKLPCAVRIDRAQCSSRSGGVPQQLSPTNERQMTKSDSKTEPGKPAKKKRKTKAPSTHPGPSQTPAEAETVAAAHGFQLTQLVATTAAGPPEPATCYWRSGSTASLSMHEREAVAWIIANEIIKVRSGANASFDLWRAASLAGDKLSPDSAKRVRPFIRPVFGLPSAPKDIGHIAGHVAEWLWYLHARELVDPTRSTLHLEPPKGHVTAPGHDGFVIYQLTADQQTVFRLWEVKKHDSTASATTVVTGAVGQLNNFGDEYLGQLTGVLSERQDAVGDLARDLVDFWVDADPRAGAGVSIASSATPPPTDCFDGVGTGMSQFPLAGQLEGLLMTVTDLENLAIDVRSFLWTVL